MAAKPAIPAGRRPTLADVAARAGVSTALVSTVMRGVKGASPATRERVLQAAQEIGYRPDARARLLRSNRSHLIGVQFDISEPFHTDLVEHLYAAAGSVGYQLALSAITTRRGERQAAESLLADRCEALILLGPQAPAARLAELAALLPLACVARRLQPSVPGVQVVRTADDEGARQAIEHLITLGHRDIAHIDGGKAPGAADRRRGYRTAMKRHGLAENIRILPAGLTAKDGAEAARALLALNPRPTAVLAFNDGCATGVLDTFFRAGISVPGDISVVGFDDSRVARLPQFDLTTVAQDIPRLAELAVSHLAAALRAGEPPTAEDIIAPHIVVRGTTAAPKAEARRLDVASSVVADQHQGRRSSSTTPRTTTSLGASLESRSAL